MTEEERFKEIADMCSSIVTRIQNEREENPEMFRELDMSGLFYSIGYIEGLCGVEKETYENDKL